jgi:NADH-quinone oxidoreductase subunit A
MFRIHSLVIFLFFSTIAFLSLALYGLSLIAFSANIKDEQQIEKLYAYECGYSSFSDAREAFDIKFYLVAILFLIFDLEIAFILPFALTLGALSQIDFISMSIFLFILTIGFVYEWKKGGLDW